MEEERTYKHYLLGSSIPVRVAFDANGLKMGAEVPDEEDGGLVKDATYLSKLEQSDEVDEITEERFKKKCEEILEKKNMSSPSVPTLNHL